MAYGYLHRGEHFGGRVLVQLAIEKNMKKQFERDKQSMLDESEASPDYYTMTKFQSMQTMPRKSVDVGE